MRPLKFLLITNEPTIARTAIAAGVDRIFVDLESRGKRRRQRGRDTVISGHALEDVARVRPYVPPGGLLVRVNPPYGGTEREIDAVIDLGADLVMLPMIRSSREAAAAADVVGDRAAFVPLIETGSALEEIDAIVGLSPVSEIYVGLNDLHLSLGMHFLFEPLATGHLDRIARACRSAGVSFGFGGIARLATGELPAEWILGEHVRLGSTSVILSRSFAGDASGLLHDPTAFGAEIDRLRTAELLLRGRSVAVEEEDRRRLRERVEELARARSNVSGKC